MCTDNLRTGKHYHGMSVPSMSLGTASRHWSTSEAWPYTDQVPVYLPLAPTALSSSLTSTLRRSWWLTYSTQPTCCLRLHLSPSRNNSRKRPPQPLQLTPMPRLAQSRWASLRAMRTTCLRLIASLAEKRRAALRPKGRVTPTTPIRRARRPAAADTPWDCLPCQRARTPDPGHPAFILHQPFREELKTHTSPSVRPCHRLLRPTRNGTCTR